jgi:hypothetical protein
VLATRYEEDPQPERVKVRVGALVPSQA